MKKQVEKKKIKLPTPLNYQRDIINWLEADDVKFVSFLKSRQSGGSFLNKLLVSKWGLESSGNKIGYITPTSKLGRLFHRELTGSLKPFILESNATELFIKFKTGSSVQFFSAESKDSIRGFQFTHCIIDEAAFINDDVYNLIIRPTFLITGKKVVMCSTPNGNNGFFFQHVQFGLDENINGYKTKFITIYDNPFISKEDIEAIRQQVPERVFKQEYLAEFLDGSGTVFTNFKNCILQGLPERNNRYFAAIDWAKQNDYTVLTILNDKKQIVFTHRMNGIDYTKQVEIIAKYLNEYKPIKTISEENNIGTVVNELLKKEYKGNLKCVTLDHSLKVEIIETLVVAFEQNLISIPNDEVLIRELQSFSCIYNTSTKTVKYSAPNGLHDDMVISLAYAYHLAKNHFRTMTVLR
jgi:phage FluMu gp28-like protein